MLRVDRPSSPPRAAPVSAPETPSRSAAAPASAESAKPARVDPFRQDTFAASSTGATRSAARATPVDVQGKSNKELDGFYVGAGGAYDPRTTRIQDIPAMEPDGGNRTGRTVIHVNGIMTDYNSIRSEMKSLANSSGDSVIGIYNATEGGVKDVIQAGLDKIRLGDNKAVNQLTDVLYDKLSKGEKVSISGYSHGGLIVSRALQNVKDRLAGESQRFWPWDKQGDAEAKLRQLVTVETYGSAASSYPDGPKYTHHINSADPVPGFFGLPKNIFGKRTGGGKDAVINEFNTWNPLSAHDFSRYMEHREKFYGQKRAA